MTATIDPHHHDGVIVDLDEMDADAALATLVRRIRRAGLAVGAVSSSAGHQDALVAAGLGDLPVHVGRALATRSDSASAPEPATLLEAVRRLGVDPARAVAVTGTAVGAQAGQLGNFALVVGVDHTGRSKQLRRHGADTVVADLTGVDVARTGRRLSEVPDALASWDELAGMLRNRRPALFLDFDGTLSEIVDDPGAASLVPGADEVLARLSRSCPVAVISGRGLGDLRGRIGVDGLWYAGSHGFELAGPDGEHYEYEPARAALPALDAAADALQDRLAGVPGVAMERKGFSVAVHYRRVDPRRCPEVIDAVKEVGGRREELRVTEGRRVVELRPDVAWDKGRALSLLLARIDDEPRLPVYAGDDLTDEDALATVREAGLGIVVRSLEHGDRPTAAHVAVGSPEEVCLLLERLAGVLARDSAGSSRPAGRTRHRTVPTDGLDHTAVLAGMDDQQVRWLAAPVPGWPENVPGA